MTTEVITYHELLLAHNTSLPEGLPEGITGDTLFEPVLPTDHIESTDMFVAFAGKYANRIYRVIKKET
jgi:hypothetical protein